MVWLNSALFLNILGKQSNQASISTTFFVLALLWSVQVANPTSAYPAEKQIIGWLETVQILPENLSLSAKIDTGADHSSLNVINQKEFRKGKEKWIRFSIPLKKNEAIRIERPVLRIARIKRRGGVPPQKRAVVLFDLCVGATYKQEVPVNLTDRSRFKYPMLIGRSFLSGTAIVDASMTFTQSPSCPLQ